MPVILGRGACLDHHAALVAALIGKVKASSTRGDKSGPPDMNLSKIIEVGLPCMLTEARIWPDRHGPLGIVSIDVHGRLRAVGRGNVSLSNDIPTISIGGRWVISGFVDPHVHVRASASAALSEDISDLKTLKGVLDVVSSAAKHTPRGAWVSVWGLQAESLDVQRPPTAEELDSVSYSRPVRIRHRSAHAWVFNTEGLARLGILTAQVDAGVSINRFPDGRPTGFVIDHSGWLARRTGRITNPEAFESAVGAWSRELARAGVVALVDATVENRASQLNQLARWRASGVIVQTIAALAHPSVAEFPQSIKVIGHKVMPPFDGPRLREILRSSWSIGTSVAVHCATTEELGVLIECVEGFPPHGRGPLRIEHASICPDEWIPRIAALPAAVVTHPSFIYAHGDRYLRSDSLRPHDMLYRLASWLRAGVTLAIASDSPAGPSAPLLAIRSACERRTANGLVLGGDEALTPEEAVLCATEAAARVGGMRDDGHGVLQVGGRADFVVVEPGDDGGICCDGAEVVATFIGGRLFA